MGPFSVAAMLLVGFAAAFVGVVTGGNSLLTVPALVALHMAPRTAVATNMFAVTFLCLSGAVRFARAARPRWDVTLPLLAVTVVTSWIGARLVSVLSEASMRGIVAASMLAMLLFLAVRPDFGAAPARTVSRARWLIGMAVAAVLGVYGGLFSGGYTTLLTFTCVALLGTSLVEAVGLTKIVNLGSSAVASAEFARQGLIDYRIGWPMAAAMMAGAWLGASLAVRLGHRFLRALFLLTILALALLLGWDFLRR